MTEISLPPELIKDVNKKYGEGTLVKGSDLKNLSFPRVTTGSLAFDLVVGGGWPMNCWCEIVGNESSGKTVLALKTIAAQQALDPEHLTLWVAAEEFVPTWAEQLGVDLDRVLLAQTNISEEAFQIVLDVQDKRGADAIVIDSLPAMTPSPELEAQMADVGVGLAARLNNKFFRKTGSAGRRSLTADDRDCLLLVVNQWREKIGVQHGDPRTTPGGKGKDFAYFVRVEVSRTEWLTGINKIKVGQTIKARAFKNKTSAPQRVGEVDFYFDTFGGFSPGDYDTLKEIFLISTAYDVIERHGAYYSFQDERLAEEAGKEHAIDRLRWDLSLQEAVKAEVARIVLHR
jgi:recombination protein RecA